VTYLNVDEVETALSIAAATHSSFTQLLTLPHNTWLGRVCHAVKLGRLSGAAKPAVFFLGGVHAREWGSADILINFVNELQSAYETATGLTFGGHVFTPSQIQDIVDTLDIIVFPQANPDGRDYSMRVDAMWRKNRRTAAPNSLSCTGVDINRNFDFLWDFTSHFASGSGVLTSTDPCDPESYCGPAAFSEPETQNCRWIFDTYPDINAFIDLHSFGRKILYSWGDDEVQATDATMTFRNAAYDGVRGIPGDAYREYLPLSDRAKAIGLAATLKTAIQAVSGTIYQMEAAYDLYPTSGASDDYAYSRHFVAPAQRNVTSFTIEWGTQFAPSYADMTKIISEITSGLMAFCLDLCNEENAMAWQNRGNSGTSPSTDFVGTIDSEPLVIKTSAAERVRITSAGNVGIGTTQPAAKLEIKDGDLLLRAAAEDPGDIVFQSAAGAQKARIWSQPLAGAGLFLSSGDNNPDITISDAGNVGIGTTQPAAKLEIKDGDLLLRAAAEDPGDIVFQNAAGAQKARIWSQPFGGAGLFLSSGDNNPDITISDAGNVGIGTTQPTAKCEIQSSGPDQLALGARSSGNGIGVGARASGTGSAVLGLALGNGVGVQGQTSAASTSSIGVVGLIGGSTSLPPVTLQTDGGIGVVGFSDAGCGMGGVSGGQGSFGNGVEGQARGPGAGIHGLGTTAASVGVYGEGTWAGDFTGNVAVQGTLYATAKSFRIDHPLDPANRFLNHCSVESPEMLTVYNGVVVTGDDGLAAVNLPNYFEVLNSDFTYQLTVLGTFAQAIIAREVEDNTFTIRTDRPLTKVSWQVTGVRHDAYANANRIAVEEDKADTERGRYLHPELYGLATVGREAVKPIGHIESMLAGSTTKASADRAVTTG
jgi:murein tripeptide amidase MpaA